MDFMLTVACFSILLCYSWGTPARGPPRINTRVNTNQAAKEGSTFRFKCPVEAEPTAFIAWTKDGENIHAGWERYKVSGLSLRIKDIMEDDGGSFVCTATNGFGSVEVRYVFYVLPDTNDTSVTPPFDINGPDSNNDRGVPPTFTDAMPRGHVMRPVGSSVRLKCKAAGRPRPQITWYRDGRMISTEGEQGHQMWTLRLSNLRQENNGQYTCRVSNAAGTINYTYELEVIDRLTKPVIADPHPLNTTVNYGETAMFQCKVRSDVQPRIQWLKRVDDRDARLNNATITVEGQRFIVLKTGKVIPRRDGSYLNKLTITSATEQHSGMYICLGANSMGYSFRSAFLNVMPNTNPRGGMYSDDWENSSNSSTESLFQSPALPLIIGIPVAVLLIVGIIAIYVVNKRRQAARRQTVIRQQRATAATYPPNEVKHYEHQYAALHPHHMHPAIQNAASRERIMKNYQDKNSDISLPHSVTPVPLPQHSHMHYGQC